MKIKVFEFLVSNWSYTESIDKEKYQKNEYALNNMLIEKTKIQYASDIEYTINEYLKNNNVELVDIKIDTIDIRYHNNGCGNTIKMIYTLIVREVK